MTPKEKAIELYNKFLNPSGDTYLYGMLEHESAKECALIAVDEMIKVRDQLYGLAKEFLPEYWEKTNYLEEVKQEIEAL